MTFAERPVTTSAAVTVTLPYAAALGALLLAGCTSGSPAPPASTSTSAAPVSTSSSTPVATSSAVTSTTAPPSPTTTVDPVLARIPAAARPETQAGALAFARYYISQVNESFTIPDAGALDSLFSPACKACVAFSDSARKLQDEGARHEGVSIESTDASVNEYTRTRRSIALAVVQHKVNVVTQRGTVVRSTKAGTGTLLATLTFNDHWSVVNLQVVK